MGKDWESIKDIYGLQYEDHLTYEELETIDKEYIAKSELDGTFTIYVTPGTYDIQVTRLAYLDYIYCNVELSENDVFDMETFQMEAGDADRNGVISQEDTNKIKSNMDKESTDADFSESYNPTQIGTVISEDLAYVKQNQDLELKIMYFK